MSDTAIPSSVLPPPSSNERPLSTGEWFVTILVLALPIIGLVMHFVWAFSDGNLGRRNFCRASLLWIAVGIALSILIFVTIVVFFGGLAALSHHAGR